ncbi:MAG TPA: hypothetical protein VMA13_01230 [Candidatus Saccharimonadales bacterium]|nr:hypothetical protein [Candidatus Saccharimonadales bacterium]
MDEKLRTNIRAYAAGRQLQIAELLGAGKDGVVWVARSRTFPTRVAVKAHRFAELYLREKAVYQRLEAKGINCILGFNVPELLGFDDHLHVVEMTIVQRPFVLDFAGAHLDARPEFSAEIWADWEAEKREQFEGRWPKVEKVLAAFEEHGIYLLDVSPGNIAFLD